jgi:hypothetical protein
MKSFKQFINETMGVNINDDVAPWTDMILAGKKTIETRNTPSLNAYIGKRVGIVRTGKKKKATLVGYCVIGKPIKYETAEDFNKDANKHHVGPDNELFNNGVKYGYPLTNVEKCEPKEIETKGIVARQID